MRPSHPVRHASAFWNQRCFWVCLHCALWVDGLATATHFPPSGWGWRFVGGGKQSPIRCRQGGTRSARLDVLFDGRRPSLRVAGAATPPNNESRMLSMRGWLTGRDARAPSAMLTDIWRWRSIPRTSIRLATLAQTIKQHESGNGHQDLEPVLVLFSHAGDAGASGDQE